MSNDYPVEIDGETGEIETLSPTKGRYRCQLETMGDVRRELAKLYREARSGIIEVNDASKLTYILGTIGKVIESSDIENRIKALEESKNDH